MRYVSEGLDRNRGGKLPKCVSGCLSNFSVGIAIQGFDQSILDVGLRLSG